jgi:hypothetical protein
MRLHPWETAAPEVERLAVSPAAAATFSLDDLVGRSKEMSAALAVLLPPPAETLAMQAAMPGMKASTVGKYLKKGFELAWENRKLILKKAGGKLIPVYNAVDTINDVHNLLTWLLPDVDSKYPTREYQLQSNSFIYRWPDGTVTAAPPPSG